VERRAEQAPPLPAQSLRRVAFGVSLELDGVNVPSLRAGVRAPAAEEPRTRVRRVAVAEIAARWVEARPERVRELRSDDGRLLLSVDFDPGVGYLMRTPLHGRFLVSPDGLEVLCAPLARAMRSFTGLLVGQLLPLVATLRGLEVLHASAVAFDGGALVFTAPPGAGKTSLALRLVLAGARLLTDDAVSIDGRGDRLMAHPGSGGLGVRREEQRRLARRDRGRLGGARRSGGKSHYDVDSAGGPVPVEALFVLRRRSTRSREPIVRRLDPVDPFLLLASTFNLSVRTPERLQRQLDVCARLADEVPILALEVPSSVDATALAACVREWAAGRAPA
jgi:hypothetical protein